MQRNFKKIKIKISKQTYTKHNEKTKKKRKELNI